MISTVDLIVLTSYLAALHTESVIFHYKTTNLNEEVYCTEPSLSVSVPWALITLWK
jgi:hypothetical protein